MELDGVDLDERYGLTADELAFDPWADETVEAVEDDVLPGVEWVAGHIRVPHQEMIL